MAKMGRPSKGKQARKVFVGVRVSPEELRRWKKEAQAAGMALGAYLLKPRRDQDGEGE
jgi:predicted DNA binding CopG/RHH family protein